MFRKLFFAVLFLASVEATAQDYGPLANGNVYDVTDYNSFVEFSMGYVDKIGLREYIDENWKTFTGGAGVLSGTQTFTAQKARHSQTLDTSNPSSAMSRLYVNYGAKSLLSIAKDTDWKFKAEPYVYNVLIRDSTGRWNAKVSHRIQSFYSAYSGLDLDALKDWARIE